MVTRFRVLVLTARRVCGVASRILSKLDRVLVEVGNELVVEFVDVLCGRIVGRDVVALANR